MEELERKTTRELLRMLIRSTIVASTVHFAGADSSLLYEEYRMQNEIERIILSRSNE